MLDEGLAVEATEACRVGTEEDLEISVEEAVPGVEGMKEELDLADCGMRIEEEEADVGV